ncbi:MAG TPA: DUF4260 domain-containing protein [Bryobacteraceae bacterium]|jgi:hypothetical protein|nr:DUF4260 domain-containing protein [Bryobacteraceae bacterium]
MNDLQISSGAVSGPVRVWLRAEGFAVLALALLLYWFSGYSWWIFFALFLTPDLIMLFYLINPKVGGVSYNVVHSYLLPLGFTALAVFLHETGMLAYLYIWMAHIGLDRLLGFGLKYPVAFRMTHLGDLGKDPDRLSALR